MTANAPDSVPDSVKDECYRCGYDLRGIANDGACPECGLLAERSRRVSDELHNTRPRWLRSLSLGIDLVLLAIIAPIAESFIAAIILDFRPPTWNPYPDLIGLDLAALLLLFGVILLTRPEGYAQADQADRGLRILMRIVAIVPALTMFVFHLVIDTAGVRGNFYPRERLLTALSPIFYFLFSFLPLLLFLRLRGLARRVRSAHLAEHCIIVGVGAFASTLYVAAVIFITNNAESWGFKTNWVTRSPVSLIMMLLLGVTCFLFILWSLYLLVRFAVAFWFAAHMLRHKWTRDDRSLTT